MGGHPRVTLATLPNVRRRAAPTKRYDNGNGGFGYEGTGRCSHAEVTDLPEQVKSVAVDDRAAVESPSVVADGYVDPDACTIDDVHEHTSSLSTIEAMLHRVGQ
jgi:hypothetical protein